MAAHGRHYLVDCGDAGLLSSAPRGKRSIYTCGDRVNVRPTGSGQAVIESALPRTTEFFRASQQRTKLIAANATQVAIFVATEPSFSDELVARVLVAAEFHRLKALIVLNKVDLAAAQARERLRPFEQAGYAVMEIAARFDVSPLRPRLHNEVTVLVGQSGMGKTTLINSLFPGTNSATREISRFLDSGRHTTAHSRLYRLDSLSAVIDCPGLQEFGLAHLTFRDIERCHPDFRPFVGSCRFQDCRHYLEPGCAIVSACEQGRIHPRRLELFRRIAIRQGRE